MLEKMSLLELEGVVLNLLFLSSSRFTIFFTEFCTIVQMLIFHPWTYFLYPNEALIFFNFIFFPNFFQRLKKKVFLKLSKNALKFWKSKKWLRSAVENYVQEWHFENLIFYVPFFPLQSNDTTLVRTECHLYIIICNFIILSYIFRKFLD